MPTVGQCFYKSIGDEGYVVAVWDFGNEVLTNKGEVVAKESLVSSGFKLRNFEVDKSVYLKLAKITEGVRVSEFLNPGDELLIFSGDYSEVSLVKITEKNFDLNTFTTEFGNMIPFGSLMGMYSMYTYPK